MLSAVLHKQLGHFRLELELACQKGKTLCIVGPSGSGKTTMLRLLAGLERPDSGRICMGRDVWQDSAKGVFLPPRKRSAGLVFQDYSLFPHMTLWQNVLYAAQNESMPTRLLKAFGIAHLKDMRPNRISGGERQRGALCQALARKPQLLLLDEPFSALDLETRLELRHVLQKMQQETPLCMVHVTHDLNEALFLGDKILPVVKGRAAPEWLERQLQLLRHEQQLLARSSQPIKPKTRIEYERSEEYAKEYM